MNFRNTTVALCALLPYATLPACSDAERTSDPNEGIATVTGRLEAGAASGATVSVMAVHDDGRTSLAGSGVLAADGSFAVTNASGGDGPFVVQIASGASLLAEVIVPQPLDDGEVVTTVPASAETTLEAEALLAIIGRGGGAEGVDTIGLITWIDAAVAASAQGQAELVGEAYLAAQAGFVAVADAHSDTSVREVFAAKLAAFTRAGGSARRYA